MGHPLQPHVSLHGSHDLGARRGARGPTCRARCAHCACRHCLSTRTGHCLVQSGKTAKQFRAALGEGPLVLHPEQGLCVSPSVHRDAAALRGLLSWLHTRTPLNQPALAYDVRGLGCFASRCNACARDAERPRPLPVGSFSVVLDPDPKRKSLAAACAAHGPHAVRRARRPSPSPTHTHTHTHTP
jgi:hypothetical protein